MVHIGIKKKLSALLHLPLSLDKIRTLFHRNSFTLLLQVDFSKSMCLTPQEVPDCDPTSSQNSAVSGISAAVLHITLFSPVLQLAAAEHGCHFWRGSSCFSLTDQSTSFQDSPLPKYATVHCYKLNV